jgi:hypothetical protein
MKLTPTETRILRVVRSCYPDAIDTDALLERLQIRNRNSLKCHAYNLRKAGVPIVGNKGGDHYGGYRLKNSP